MILAAAPFFAVAYLELRFIPFSFLRLKVCVEDFKLWLFFQVRADWIVEEGSMLTAAQQAQVTSWFGLKGMSGVGVQTAVRKRRVMYVLILMVVVFMTSWLPLSAVNLIKDLEIPLVSCCPILTK